MIRASLIRPLVFAYAGEFFVRSDVDYFECFGVEPRVSPEFQFAEVAFLHLDKMLFVFRAKTFEDRRMDYDAKLEIRLVARTFL